MDIDFCAKCNVPRSACKGEMARCRAWKRYNAKLRTVKTTVADPCATCYTRKIGACVDGTCSRRRAYEVNKA